MHIWYEFQELCLPCIIMHLIRVFLFMHGKPPRGRGGTPLHGSYRYVRPKGYGFSAVLVVNRVPIFAR